MASTPLSRVVRKAGFCKLGWLGRLTRFSGGVEDPFTIVSES